MIDPNNLCALQSFYFFLYLLMKWNDCVSVQVKLQEDWVSVQVNDAEKGIAFFSSVSLRQMIIAKNHE